MELGSVHDNNGTWRQDGHENMDEPPLKEIAGGRALRPAGEERRAKGVSKRKAGMCTGGAMSARTTSHGYTN
jgi:hypothetical protein